MEWYKWIIISSFLMYAIIRIFKSKEKDVLRSSMDNLEHSDYGNLEFKNSITGEKLIFKIILFDCNMDWNSAEKACRTLGNGWRLPNIKELELFYSELYVKGRWHYRDRCYFWSSTLVDYSENVFVARFPEKESFGCAMTLDKSLHCSVLAVNTI